MHVKVMETFIKVNQSKSVKHLIFFDLQANKFTSGL